jgi:hypothetical protein
VAEEENPEIEEFAKALGKSIREMLKDKGVTLQEVIDGMKVFLESLEKDDQTQKTDQ